MGAPEPGRRQGWFAGRFDLSGLTALAGRKMVPVGRHTPWTFLGGILLFLFVLQVATGVLLMIHYRPTAAEAHQSLVRIVTEVPAGWLVRSLHAWGAHLMVMALLAHFFSTFFLKAYRRPRELTWITGALLLVLTMAMGFSGYLLPWDELALTATRVGTDVPRALGPPGEIASSFLRGGEDVTAETLGRFFAFHVALFPLLLAGAIVLHLALVQLQGMSLPPGERPGREMPFFPNLFYRDLAIWTVLFGVLASLATIFPPGLGPEADPLAPTPPGLKPEWYFLFLFQTIKLFPGHLLGIPGESVAVALVMAAIAFLFVIPLVDRRASRGEPSPRFTLLGWAALAYFLGMSLWGFLS
jgi:cytochrome b6